MKNAINYYYNLPVDEVHFSAQQYYFKIENQLYILMTYYRPFDEIDAIVALDFEIIKYNSNFHQIILNKDRQAITIIENIPYVLLKINVPIDRPITSEDLVKMPVTLSKQLSLLDRSNWVQLWSNKLDYFEEQMGHMELEFPLLRENVIYFIGLGENSISYIRNTFLEERPSWEDRITICHRRISIKDTTFTFYNPLNLVLDYPVRDVSEYLKSLFWFDQYKIEEIEPWLRTNPLSNFEARLLFGRLLFPSFFFDQYEKIIDHQIEEKRILEITTRTDEYEQFLMMIYRILKEDHSLPEIEWLNKKM